MDKTYFLTFKVKQSEMGGQFEKYTNVQATCWVKAFSAISAFRESIYFLKKEQWKVTSFEENIVQVTREMFIGKDIGLDQFDKAQKHGFSIFYVGVDENLIAPEFVSFDDSEKLDIAQFLKNKNLMDRHEFCLHPKTGSDCDEKIIRAHSIQNNQSLSAIADNGHVYQLDKKYQHETKTYLEYKRIGINKASVFKGFCKKHDNEIFEPIDNYLLEPTAEQVFLYAYRSICKEIYQKYKVIQVLKENIPLVNSKDQEQLGWHLMGNQKGYEELIKIKKSYDETFLNKSFEKDILYVIFYSKKPMNLAFSSLIYPDFDFQNNLLQDLDDFENDKDLITYFSAPMDGGWGYVFAWHMKNNLTCKQFAISLGKTIDLGRSIEHTLFQYMLLNSENHALSPYWWESLEQEQQSQILYAINHKVDLMSGHISSQDNDEIPEVSGWEFIEVMTNIDLR